MKKLKSTIQWIVIGAISMVMLSGCSSEAAFRVFRAMNGI